MFRRAKPDVLVVGAGPVGLFAALWLTRRGVKVEVIDEQWRGTTRSYALALHPRSLELLDELGVAGDVLARARRLGGIGLYEGGERYAHLAVAALPSKFPFLATIAQSTLEEILGDALARNGVKIQWNHRLGHLEPAPDAARVTIEALGKVPVGYAIARNESVVMRTRTLDVPFVLGADGHGSLVRQQSDLDFEAVSPAQYFAVFEADATGEVPDEVCVVLEPERASVMWPMPDGRVRWSFELPDPIEVGDGRDKDRLLLAVDAEHAPRLDDDRLTALLRARAPWFHGHIEGVAWRTVVRFERRLASAFGAGRAWLVGDAGHLTGPVGVHSMNVGLREAAELGDDVARVVAGRAPAAVLDDYNQARLREWRYLLGVTPRLHPGDRTDPWIAARWDRLVDCLPASGAHLEALLDQAASLSMLPPQRAARW
ncbi:MAG: FAD-dependent monooxygenase [Kofleriaceae bacterium]|nr:FAD-dependent monooxygenase [Myxococcales bacterium]MCB9564601.1 FAD-dependent monooxygenase [Kofleriaceae bacterium]